MMGVYNSALHQSDTPLEDLVTPQELICSMLANTHIVSMTLRYSNSKMDGEASSLIGGSRSWGSASWTSGCKGKRQDSRAWLIARFDLESVAAYHRIDMVGTIA